MSITYNGIVASASARAVGKPHVLEPRETSRQQSGFDLHAMSEELCHSAEWDILCALHDYLAIPLAVNLNAFDDLTESTISFCNLRDSFAYELTRVFVYFGQNRSNQDPYGATFEHSEQLKLEKLCQLLNSLVNSKVIQSQSPGSDSKFHHIFVRKDKDNGAENVLYQRIRTLLEYLDESKALLALIYGNSTHSSTPAFNLPQAETIEVDLRTVQDVNHFFDSTLHPSSQGMDEVLGAAISPQLTNLAQTIVRDYAIAAFDTVFEYLKVCQTTHTIMLHLSSLVDHSDVKQEAQLDLFISACPYHEEWQEARCGPCKNAKVRQVIAVEKGGLCDVVEESKLCEEGLRIHVVGRKLQNLSEFPQAKIFRHDYPNESLHSLITGGALKPLDIDNLASIASNRFDKSQKKKLVSILASSLTHLYGSPWTRKGWDSKDIYFHFSTDGADQTAGSLPFGPFVSCSNGGPVFLDLPKWSHKLPESSALLFFAKLLLEIDLGQDFQKVLDLDKTLEAEIKTDLWRALNKIYKKYRADLDYSEAIQACLQFHRIEKCEMETGDLEGSRDLWAKKYILEKVVQKLEIPPINTEIEQRVDPSRTPSLLPQRMVEGLYRRSHDKFSSANSRLSAPDRTCFLQFGMPTGSHSITQLTSISCPDEGLISSPIFGTASAPTNNPIPKQIGRSSPPKSAIEQMKPTAEVANWLNATDEYASDSQNPNAEVDNVEANGLLEDEYENVLFDAVETKELQGDERSRAIKAMIFWKELKRFNDKHMPRRPCRTSKESSSIPTQQSRNIKIALIDTGVNLNDTVVAVEKKRFSGKSWVDDHENQFHDTCGHGTHLARLVLKVTSVADIIVGKVSSGKNFTKENVLNIAKAITWAVEQDADIISLSFGFRTVIPEIQSALQEAIRPSKSRVAPRIVFAAAGNWGWNFPKPFPATEPGVLCIQATNGQGVFWDSNTLSDVKKPIATLGVAIESSWNNEVVWLSGTSFAAPIAAGIAANVLEFAKQKMNLNKAHKQHLFSYRGMRAVLKTMCVDLSTFAYLSPWQLQENHNCKTSEDIAKKFEEQIINSLWFE